MLVVYHSVSHPNLKGTPHGRGSRGINVSLEGRKSLWQCCQTIIYILTVRKIPDKQVSFVYNKGIEVNQIHLTSRFQRQQWQI